MALNLALEATIEAQLYLVGEEVYRRSTGMPVGLEVRACGYQRIGLASGSKRSLKVYYHRAKFFLHFGWMPDEVDHRDRDPSNSTLANLRPATRKSNTQNSYTAAPRELPRGVHFQKGKYRAGLKVAGKQHWLGTYNTIAEAEEAVNALRLELHGEFYCQN